MWAQLNDRRHPDYSFVEALKQHRLYRRMIGGLFFPHRYALYWATTFSGAPLVPLSG